MKRKGLLILGLIAAVSLVSVPATISALVFALPNVYQYTLYGAMKGKIDRVSETKGKKIVVIGGSSVPFSLNSKLIKECLPAYEPVDFGLYASLGTNLMLDLALPHIGSGDIVIVTPEISAQTLSLYYDGLETYKALEQNKGLLFSLDRKMGEALVGASSSWVSEKMAYLTKGAIPIPKDIYAKDSFNEYGDISVWRQGNILPGGVDKNRPIRFEISDIGSGFMDKLNAFGKTCKERNASVYFRFSPVNDASITNKENLGSFYDYLKNGLAFPILGDPYAATLEKEWFYDTNYHLNSYGVKKWTKRFIQDIKLTLDDTSVTPLEDVDMPPLVGPSEDKDGDNSFVDHFSYVSGDDEATITGLLKEETSIVVPYRYQGKIVTSFEQKTFQGTAAVEEITIQDNIRMLHDGSFANSSIKRIVIENDLPNSLAVGEDLLRDSSAEIYVRAENVSAYKTSYNWAKYATKIHAIPEN